MASLNKMTAIGNLGADPELRFTPDGKPVTNLRVPANDPVFNKETNEWMDNTIWIQAAVWDEQAERVAEKARKGDLVYIEGPLRMRNYTTNDGRQGTALEMRRVNKFILLERRSRDDEGPAPARSEPRPEHPEMDIDDIPF